MIDERFELLCQKHLDGEATETERDELKQTIATDSAARRRFDEFVALEGLLFEVGNTDRTDDRRRAAVGASHFDSELADRGRESIPDEEDAVMSGTWMSSLAGAAALALIIWWGIPETPTSTHDSHMCQSKEISTPLVETLEVAALSEGLRAIVQDTEDPLIQFIWITETFPRKEATE